MRGFILFVCLTVGCLAEQPKCSSPPQMDGGFSVATQNEKFFAAGKYTYDALGKRIHLKEMGISGHKKFYTDVLLLFNQGVMYKINQRNRTCCKKTLSSHFHPLEIPESATLLSKTVLGSISAAGEGVPVNTWIGTLQLKKRGEVKYISTVTELGCIPISHLFHTKRTSWVVVSFFNNTIGIKDPSELTPPSFCKDAQLDGDDGEEPVDFYSLF